MNTVQKTLLAVGGLGLIVGLVYHFKSEYDKIMQYTYKIDKFAVKSFDSSGMVFEMGIIISNPSDVMLKLQSFNFDILINGKYVTTVKNDIEQFVPAKSKSIPIKCDIVITSTQVGLSDIGTWLQQSILDPSNLKITTKGVVSIDSGILSFGNIPVNITMSYADF